MVIKIEAAARIKSTVVTAGPPGPLPRNERRGPPSSGKKEIYYPGMKPIVAPKAQAGGATAEDAGLILTRLTKILGEPSHTTKADLKQASMNGWQKVTWEDDFFHTELVLDAHGEIHFHSEHSYTSTDANSSEETRTIEIYSSKGAADFFKKLKKEMKGAVRDAEEHINDYKDLMDNAKATKKTFEKMAAL